MKQVATTLGLIAGASLLQACGTSDGTSAPLTKKAKQMLYLPADMDVYDLKSQSSRSVAGFNEHSYEKNRYYLDSNRPEHNLLFHLLFNARPDSTDFSKEYFDLWITYQLLNSFVLAMGDELDTVSSARINTHIEKIRTAVEQNRSVKEIMLDYFMADIFWARFRSPEDNGREVFEIYLGDFRDEIVPPAAKILQNYSFNEDQGTLEIDSFNRNSELQHIDGAQLTTPYQLYSYVVNHGEFMTHIYKHIVKALYGYEASDVINSMSSKGLSTFRDIYIEALTHTSLEKVKRAKFPEEILFPALKSFNAHLRRDDIRELANISAQIGSQPLFSKLERRAPDWNSLNTALMSAFVDSRIPKEMWDTGNDYSWGISQTEFLKLYQFSESPSELLTEAHRKIWGTDDIQYDQSFVDYLNNSGKTGKALILLAIQIVAMDYRQYNYQ
ncbi:hypothetical protein [Oceanospirillum sanctuarii]|uniref:hypothetical protein n=1 Tax=Oceanospirillum sanctuarii TaxID=1434821 RepID=UPI000A38C7C2|nr:hypothetical protein [Oceanospirillum sanctuarii]